MTKQEIKKHIKNSLVHIAIATGIAGIIVAVSWYFGLPVWIGVVLSHVTVFITSIGIETYQYYKMDNQELKIWDRIFDIFTYQVGCGMVTGSYAICY